MNDRPVTFNQERIKSIIDILDGNEIPAEQESSSHDFRWNGNDEGLANCYLAIVAICHQTSPIGEKQLQGKIQGKTKSGWDYLKQKYILTAIRDPDWIDPARWAAITLDDLATLYYDDIFGQTLSRLSERAFLLNELGNGLLAGGFKYIHEVFIQSGQIILGIDGFQEYLNKYEAYSDPLAKKTFFFVSLATKECGWDPIDQEELPSPIDYHELRGHLRLGTIVINDRRLARKVELGLGINHDEDLMLRRTAQEINQEITAALGTTNSRLHYMFWNIFRRCCLRNAKEAHCISCNDSCGLPSQYKEMKVYQGGCIFSEVCGSADIEHKIIEPLYKGHYY